MSKNIASVALLAVAMGLSGVSNAAIYTVNNTNISGAGSLAQALTQAQSDTNATINLNSGLGSIVLSGALPQIQNNLVINGNSNNISGSNSLRIFFVNAPSKTIQINGLALLNGVAQGGNGGAGEGGGGGGAGLGGAIFLNAGSLTVSNVAFSNNAARGGAGSIGFNGGHGQSGGGGGGGGMSFAGGAGGVTNGDNAELYVGPGGGGGALTSAGAAGNPNSSNAGPGGGVNGGQGGLLAVEGAGGNGASPTLADGGGGGGGWAVQDTSGANGGNGGNGSDFSGGGGAGSSEYFSTGIPGNGGFGGGGGGGAYAFTGAYGGGNGGFGGGGGGGGQGGDAGGVGGTGGFGGGVGANNVTGNGGGGLGAGGAIFARLGSTLTLQDCTFNGDTVVAGPAGASPAIAGSAMGQALFLGGNVNYYVSSGTNVLGETIGGGNDVNARGSFTKIGPGTLVFTSNESYFGNTVVSNGVLEIVNNLPPSPTVIISSNAVLDYNYNARILGSGVTYLGTGTLRIDGTGGNVVFGPGATYVDFSPGAWVDVEAGQLTGSSSWEGYWNNNCASLNIASNAVFDAVEASFASAMQIDALTGAGTFSGGYVSNPNGGLTTLTIGIAGGSGTFSGKLLNDVNARLGIVKVGAGTEILTGTNNTYSGNTIVGGGSLIINGNAGTGTVTVTNGTLGGTGTIAGAVTVVTNGAFAPGIGTFTISNTLTLAGNTIFSLNTGTYSKVTGLSNVTYGGTLTITNVGAPLVAGLTYNLFSTAAHSGNFASVTGYAGNNLAFNFNPTNGVLSVVQTSASAPANLSFTTHPGTFTVNWPSNYTGWTLQVQTNDFQHGLGTNWVDVPGSAEVSSLDFPSTTNGSVFFRLRLPVF